MKGNEYSGQNIATSPDPTPKGSLGREIPLFQGNLDWWNIIIWPEYWRGHFWPSMIMGGRVVDVVVSFGCFVLRDLKNLDHSFGKYPTCFSHGINKFVFIPGKQRTLQCKSLVANWLLPKFVFKNEERQRNAHHRYGMSLFLLGQQEF